MSGTPHICVCKICSQTFIPKAEFGHRCPECIRMRRIALPKWASAAALLMVAVALPALEWTYDKQLHAAAGALLAYSICDVLQDTTDLRPWQRWCIATASTAIVGELHEQFMGYKDQEDALASGLGGAAGATLHTGFSLMLSKDRASLGVAWRF